MHIADKPLRYRELIRKLKKFGVIEENRRGRRKILFHPNIDGKPAQIPIHPHSEHYEFSRSVIRSVRERFKIDLDDFYNA